MEFIKQCSIIEIWVPLEVAVSLFFLKIIWEYFNFVKNYVLSLSNILNFVKPSLLFLYSQLKIHLLYSSCRIWHWGCLISYVYTDLMLFLYLLFFCCCIVSLYLLTVNKYFDSMKSLKLAKIFCDTSTKTFNII